MSEEWPRYVVVNPMHIITLHERTRSFGVRVAEAIKSFSERWFSHILLLLFLIGYAAAGALLFQWAEAPREQREKLSVVRSRDLVARSLLHFRNLSDAAWLERAKERLYAYELQLLEHQLSKAPEDSEKQVWTFWSALFYAGTVFTTIGYGHIVPATVAGQAITIVYAFIGIPFLLMVLADLGKLFTRWIKAVFYYTKLFCKTGRFRRARRMGRRATAVPIQYMTVAWNKMPYMVYQGKSKKKPPDEKEVTDELEKKDETEEKEEEIVKESPAIIPEDDDEFDLPVSVAILLLVGYMMLGAFLFTLWEPWTFFESFYFVFISMSTIGFGDYVPTHQMFMMAAFIYLLFGLALTSMCINVVQEKLSATFQMAKLRIGTTIGLDANMLEATSDKSETPASKSRRGSKSTRSDTGTPDPEKNPDPEV